MNGWIRILVVVGGIITLGFGIWHIFVPHLYRWPHYMADLPAELERAIMATNFFFSISLALLGAMTLVLVIWFAGNIPFIRIWLWMMSGLWFFRVLYQAVKPQGTMIPGLSWIMLAVFTTTAALFCVPALVITFKT